LLGSSHEAITILTAAVPFLQRCLSKPFVFGLTMSYAGYSAAATDNYHFNSSGTFFTTLSFKTIRTHETMTAHCAFNQA
jgi:hypothetical protein